MTYDGLQYLMSDAGHNELFSKEIFKRDVLQIDLPQMAAYSNAALSDFNVYFKNRWDRQLLVCRHIFQ